ncbi:Hypothetical protein PHPALM_12059 [Phytophthora palmivora]|uniref:RxLR effector protein n=1 Tax=Phytophthora palmivora TaxID=4796 RepID=A0A2P4Y0P9_9STRA|nr:Hypothetical protein PHPALM_12059 [Phytophthora palmivora]
MHLSYTLLLAIAVTLLGSSSAATAFSRSTGVSAMTSPELTGIGQVIGSEKRSLRYHDNGDRTEKEDEDDNVGEEERTGAISYVTKKLNEMLASVKRAQNGDDGGMVKGFAKMKKAKYNPNNPRTVVDQDKDLKYRQALMEWANNKLK